MLRTEVFRVASTCSLATQVPFPVMPAHMTTRIPLPVFSDVGPSSSNCVLAQVVRPRAQSRITTAMVFQFIVPFLDSYEILLTTKTASKFVSFTPAFLKSSVNKLELVELLLIFLHMF